MSNSLRILVVDESALYRKLVAETLASLPGVEVAGTAVNTEIAMVKIEELRPRLVTIGVSDASHGWAAVERIRATYPAIGVIALPDVPAERNRPEWAASLAGVVDKPTVATIAEMRAVVGRLALIVVAQTAGLGTNRRPTAPIDCAEALSEIDGGPRRGDPSAAAEPSAANRTTAADELRTASQRLERLLHSQIASREASAARRPPELVCIGISTGGPEALMSMLPALPADLAAPVLLVQHMPPGFTKSLAEGLDARCALDVCEAIDGEIVLPGSVRVAPGGRHLKVERADGNLVLRISDDPPENNCKPAVDYLFRSAADACDGAVLAVIMTGMGSDGLRGLRYLKQRGAACIAQDRESCVVYGMPMLPVEEGLADEVVPLANIAETIVRLAGRGVRTCR